MAHFRRLTPFEIDHFDMKIEFFLNWLIFAMQVWNEKKSKFDLFSFSNNNQMKFESILFRTNITTSKIGFFTSFDPYL